MGDVTVHDGEVEDVENASFVHALPHLSTETVFELLGDRYRRTVLSYLENRFEAEATVAELAAYVSQDLGVGESPSEVKIGLHHSALPRLDEAGLVEYDTVSKTAQYIGHPLVEDCLDLVDTE